MSPFAFYSQVSKRPIFKKNSPAGGCWSRREAPHPWVPALQILAGFCHQVRAPRVRAPTGARTFGAFFKYLKRPFQKNFPRRGLLVAARSAAPMGTCTADTRRFLPPGARTQGARTHGCAHLPTIFENLEKNSLQIPALAFTLPDFWGPPRKNFLYKYSRAG